VSKLSPKGTAVAKTEKPREECRYENQDWGLEIEKQDSGFWILD
jgi:hypothetical protein